jgi:ribosomal protein L7/L12
MELIYILIAALIIVLPIILTKFFSGRTRDAREVPDAKPATKPATAADAPESVWQEAGRLLAQHRKIDAIKLMREKTGLDLSAAKDAVETLEKFPASARAPSSLTATIRRAEQTSEEVQKLVAQGRKVEAVKLIRDQTGLGLKEARELVDRLR